VEVLFTLRAERYERRSLLITSNLMFVEWDRIFKNRLTLSDNYDDNWRDELKSAARTLPGAQLPSSHARLVGVPLGLEPCPSIVVKRRVTLFSAFALTASATCSRTSTSATSNEVLSSSQVRCAAKAGCDPQIDRPRSGVQSEGYSPTLCGRPPPLDARDDSGPYFRSRLCH